MQTQLKAIDTRYAGHLFRSRLEARFAIFMDALNWQWNYEVEGFDLPNSGFYLPDFLVTLTPDIDLPRPFWVEVKATSPTVEEINKLRELCCLSNQFGFFFVGHDNCPPNSFIRPNYWQNEPTFKRLASLHMPYELGVSDSLFLKAEPFSYGQLPTKVFSPATGIAQSLVHEMKPEDRKQFQEDMELQQTRFYDERLSPGVLLYPEAAKEALSARFEHGARTSSSSAKHIRGRRNLARARRAAWEAC